MTEYDEFASDEDGHGECRREIDQLQADLRAAALANGMMHNDLHEMRAKVAKLQETLQPFAQAVRFSTSTVDGEPLTDETLLSRYEAVWGATLTCGDCHLAAAVLEETK